MFNYPAMLSLLQCAHHFIHEGQAAWTVIITEEKATWFSCGINFFQQKQKIMLFFFFRKKGFAFLAGIILLFQFALPFFIFLLFPCQLFLTFFK